MNLNALRERVLERAAGSPAFRARLVEDTAAAIEEETGVPVPKGFAIAAHEDPTHGLQFTLSGAVSLADAELAGIVGGSGQDGWEAYGWETKAEADAAWESAFPGSTAPWNE